MCKYFLLLYMIQKLKAMQFIVSSRLFAQAAGINFSVFKLILLTELTICTLIVNNFLQGLSFICLMLYRVDQYDQRGYYSASIDARYLAELACIGFFFISLVQIVSILLGDKTPTSVCMTIYHILGFRTIKRYSTY